MVTSLVKKVMEEKRVTIRAMAQKTGLSDATILRARREIIQCRLSTLEIISECLGVEIKDLYRQDRS